MKLDRNDVIHGYSAKNVRDFLGYARSGAFAHTNYCKLDIFLEIANRYFHDNSELVIDELLKRGWIIRGKGSDQKECRTEDADATIVMLTKAGKQSRAASLNRRFSRADGEAVISELIERAKAINARDELPCGIAELRLYGSMLDPKAETVGDVDVAYALFFKRPPPGKTQVDWQIERAELSGRNIGFDKMDTYGIAEVKQLLKARKPRLSLQEMYHFDRMEPRPQFRVIYETDRKLTPPKGTIRKEL